HNKDAKSVTWNKLVESFTQEFSRFYMRLSDYKTEDL
ncbi:hypothetical protein Q604_UNBC00803G0001, partial [human gut metagenome]